MYKKMNKTNKYNVMWNMLGGIATSLASVLLLLAVTRVSGPEIGGIFSIGFAAAQMMLTIGCFGMRTYQATDVIQEYKFEDYLSSRIITCCIMIICSIFYAYIFYYNSEKFLIVIAMCILKMFDAFADVFEGQFQQISKLDIASKSLFYRTFFSTTIYIIILIVINDILITTIITSLINVILLYIFTIVPAKKYFKIAIIFKWNKIKSLIKECFVLFTSTFLIMFIYNVPKYAIDQYMYIEIQTYYNILFMPAAVINLFSGFIFRPLLTTLATYFNTHDKDIFKRITYKLIVVIIGLTIFVLVVGELIGISILSLIYGVDLSAYKQELLIILCGGGVSAIVSLIYHVITVIRKQKWLLSGYISSMIITVVIVPKLVKELGMLGASVGYLISMSVLLAIFFVILNKCMKNF